MSCNALPLSSGRVQLASESTKGGFCALSCQNDSLKVVQVFRRQRCECLIDFRNPMVFQLERNLRVASRIFRSHGQKRYGRGSRSIITSALPAEAISAAAAIVIVIGSVGALIWLNQDKWKNVVAGKPKCEACDGSGLCSSCNGEGFQLKSLSPEAAARARANARDAATRYTAGLAKKWSYCTNCSGSRNCPDCSGTGSVNITQTGS